MGRRGRKPKSETVQKDLVAFAADKDELLKVFDRKAVELGEDVIKKFDILPVAHTSMLGGDGLDLFSGKDYEEAINNAYRWAERKNKGLKDIKIELLHYFPQRAFGNTVLVSYNVVSTH